MRIEDAVEGLSVRIVGRTQTELLFGWVDRMDKVKTGRIIETSPYRDTFGIVIQSDDSHRRKNKWLFAPEDLELITVSESKTMLIFDNFEVGPVILVEKLEDGTEVLERVLESDVQPEDIYVWTVYGHLPIGGVEALADFHSKEQAMYVYKALMTAYIGE